MRQKLNQSQQFLIFFFSFKTFQKHKLINFDNMQPQYPVHSTRKNKNLLTGTSLIVHVRLAAGLEFFDVQLARKLSPIRYFGLIP